MAAVNNGCDAIYLGLDSFNARMKAPNFAADSLLQWVDYCHLFGVKVYVAINTSLKNNEFVKAAELLLNVYKCCVDGVIVTDLALMRIAGSLPKPFEVVASTQLNVHDKYGAEFVKKCGATTVVCARECSIDDICEIASTGINVECFLHGAMCVCQSGQCLFSSMVGGNSGNRGLCAQPCRKYYYVNDDVAQGGYLLSARDMCGLYDASKLINAGATTFKIEGRNRRPEYAGLTSRIYRKLMDNNCNAGNNDFVALAEMFNRGMSANRYLNGANSDIVYPTTQNHIGVEVGRVKSGGVIVSVPLSKGDGLKVFSDGKEVCGGVALESGAEYVKVQFGGKVRDGMKVHRTTCVELCNDILSSKRKLDVDLEFVAKINEQPVITATYKDVSVTLQGNCMIAKAQKAPISESEIVKQLQKSGETHYTICNIVIKIDDIFMAKSQINMLRRNVLEKLTQKIGEEYNKRFSVRKGVGCSIDEIIKAALGDNVRDCSSKIIKAACVAAVCYDEQQLQLASTKCDYLIYKPDAVDAQAFVVASKHNAYVDLPSFADLRCISDVMDITRAKFICNNVGQVEFARRHGIDYIAGSGLNIFNDRIADEFDDAITFVYSRELTLKEISEFDNNCGLTFVDGLMPLMQLCHCPYKVAYNCDCGTCQSATKLTYRDELGNKFVIRRRQAGKCLFELINGNKLSVVSRLKTIGRYLVDYDQSVVDHYVNINNGVFDGYVEYRPYTKGRLYDKIN